MGSAEHVIQTMRQFVLTATSDAAELKKYWKRVCENPIDDGALQSYRIKIHAMKTSAVLCGALQVYGAAAWIEYAARKEKVQVIIDITPFFLEYWQSLYESLKSYFGEIQAPVTQKEAINQEKLDHLLHQLITSMEHYDIKSADSILAQIEGYDFGERLSTKFDALRTAVANLDAEMVKTICNEVMT